MDVRSRHIQAITAQVWYIQMLVARGCQVLAATYELCSGYVAGECTEFQGVTSYLQQDILPSASMQVVSAVGLLSIHVTTS